MTLDRRYFLRNTALGAVGIAFAEPLLGLHSSLAQASPLTKTIVVVNLFGGNDGLNTVIPIDQYDRYRQMRPGLGHAQSALLPLPGTPQLGLNPGMSALRNLYAQGRVAVLNGVGVPHQANGLFDHSAQQYEFQSCDIVRSSSGAPPTGWLGRYLDTAPPSLVSPGIDLGGGRLMLTGQAYDPLTVYSVDELELPFSGDGTARRAAYEAIMAMPSANAVGERNRTLRVLGLQQADALHAAVAGYQPLAVYPESSLGSSLRECAKIISGNVGVSALAVGAGGYDTHRDQNQGGGATALGYHDQLLKDVSDSISAFYADLVAHHIADQVLILTISEFGRTPFQNSAGGTDHGYSSVAFAIGNSVHGGVYGQYPGLQDQWLVFDGLTDVVTDFRSVYATAFASFLDVDPVPLVGGNFPLLGYV